MATSYEVVIHDMEAKADLASLRSRQESIHVPQVGDWLVTEHLGTHHTPSGDLLLVKRIQHTIIPEGDTFRFITRVYATSSHGER